MIILWTVVDFTPEFLRSNSYRYVGPAIPFRLHVFFFRTKEHKILFMICFNHKTIEFLIISPLFPAHLVGSRASCSREALLVVTT